ncbi:hypothetical protein Tco_0682711 [Tanacetum coccineum]|uniref:Uncharacterized protein n=1 Tax=Tanacetum coccineum TaxID=301880 RepID=A0ABQ4XTI3_9ASTR
MAGLLFRMFRVDRIEFKGTMQGEQLQLENGVVLDEEQLLFIAGRQDNAFDAYVDEPPTMFMAILSVADPIYDEAGLSYDSNILSEVQDHDNCQDIVVCAEHDRQNKVVNESLTAELARHKGQVELYEKRARFELTEREQKIDEQLRIIITDRNYKEESLKKELHYVKMQLNSTINHNKLRIEEVNTLKKEFKHKENRYLEDFLDMKALKEKVENKLFKQDQSLQIVYMLCKPKPYYAEKKMVAIGYKNHLYITKAMQVQSALYNGHEIVKTIHAPAVLHDSEDTLDVAEKTRIGMLEKMKSPLWVDSKIKIAPPDYLKENYLATFTPKRHLTP